MNEETGLEINIKKTKILGNGEKNIQSKYEIIEKMNELVYLGQQITSKNKGGKEISRKI